MKMRMLLVAGFILLSGCGQPGIPMPTTSAPGLPAATQSPSRVTQFPPTALPVIPLHPTATFRLPAATLPAQVTMLPLDSAPEALLSEARARLAQKLGIDSAQISLFLVQVVEWPDASLGCPRAGEAYAQVITPGYNIFLEAEGSIYSFHTDQESQIILCEVEPPHEIYQPP